MGYFRLINEKESKEIIPGFFARFVHTENVTLVFWEARAGSTFPEHAHPHEQISTIQKGKISTYHKSKNKNFRRRRCCGYSLQYKTLRYRVNRLQID